MEGNGCAVEEPEDASVGRVSPITGNHERKFSHPFGSPLLGFAGRNFDESCLKGEKLRINDNLAGTSYFG